MNGESPEKYLLSSHRTNADFVGIVLGMEKPLSNIRYRGNEVVYSFQDNSERVLTAEEVAEMAAEEKPHMLAFLSGLYGHPIKDLRFRKGRAHFTGTDGHVGCVRAQDFISNLGEYKILKDQLGSDKALLSSVGIDPFFATYILNTDYGLPTIRSIDGGRILIDLDVGGEADVSEASLKDRTEILKSHLLELSGEAYDMDLTGLKLFDDFVTLESDGHITAVPIEDFENRIKDHASTKIEYVIARDDIQYRGSSLLGEASMLDHLQALDSIKGHSEQLKDTRMDGTFGPESIVRAFRDGENIITEILPLSEFEIHHEEPRYFSLSPKIRRHLSDDHLPDGLF